MKILVSLIEKANDTLEEIEWYAEKAHHLRIDHKNLADTYIEIADLHIGIFNMLHKRMVELIDEERKKGMPPQEMVVIWNYEHEKIMKEFAESKFLVDDYKKSY